MKLTQEIKEDYATHAAGIIRYYQDDEEWIQFDISIHTFIPWNVDNADFDASDYEDELGEIFDECALYFSR
ncbi:hypothetical protein N9B85_00580 [bacterium]|nr:hypothetical protein [bacterium]